jgi:hypothetical protein
MQIERTAEISAICYQDFFKVNPTSQKFIPFPKLLIFELVDHPSEYPKYYIRMYERKELDSKI